MGLLTVSIECTQGQPLYQRVQVNLGLAWHQPPTTAVSLKAMNQTDYMTAVMSQINVSILLYWGSVNLSKNHKDPIQLISILIPNSTAR